MQPDNSHFIGVDLVEVSRITKAVSRWGDRFLHRIYTPAELAEHNGRAASLAGRFAAKEAVMKALGAGPEVVSWREIEILREPRGQPSVHLHGQAKKKAAALGLRGFSVSISHTAKYAVAFVVGQTSPSKP